MPKQTFFNLPPDKRQRIINVALEEFAARPYSKASLSNIVARAGIAKGSMYQYFEDKKDLYTYLFDLAAQEKLAYIGKMIDPAADFFTAVEQTMLAGMRFNLEHPRLSQVYANAMEPLGEEILHELYIKSKSVALDFLEQMIRRGQQQGSVRLDVDTRLAACWVYSILGTALLDYILDSLGVTIKEMLADPPVARKFTEDRMRGIISEVMKLLRSGLSAKER